MANKINKSGKKPTAKIEWPTTHFTIDDIQKKYPDVVNITLRFRVNKAVDETKELVVIGKIKPAIGRPKLVFAKANPSAELLANATAAGVLPPTEGGNTAVTVAEVKVEKKQPKAVVPATAPKETVDTAATPVAAAQPGPTE
jgi:hypothetical protein